MCRYKKQHNWQAHTVLNEERPSIKSHEVYKSIVGVSHCETEIEIKIITIKINQHIEEKATGSREKHPCSKLILEEKKMVLDWG